MQEHMRPIDDTHAAPRFAFPLVLVLMVTAMAFVGSSLTEALDYISHDLPVSIAPPE